ncbi:MAG: aminotransferase class V-fold PLP-dependent enzyme, partial [Candidatus Nanohaloarchaea archaeon]
MDAAEVRDVFPVIDGVHYLDSACMALRPEPVIEAVERYYREFPACAGRSNHSLGDQATEAVETGRKQVAAFLGVDPSNLVFTRNTTEAINLVAHTVSPDVVVTS